MVCKSPYKSKRLMLISNFFYLETEREVEKSLLWEGLCTDLITSQGWSKQKVKIIVYQIICFSIDYSIWDPSFSNFWTLSTDIRLGTSEKKALINPYSTRFYSACTKMGWYWRFTINTINPLLQLFHLQRLMVWE